MRRRHHAGHADIGGARPLDPLTFFARVAFFLPPAGFAWFLRLGFFFNLPDIVFLARELQGSGLQQFNQVSPTRSATGGFGQFKVAVNDVVRPQDRFFFVFIYFNVDASSSGGVYDPGNNHRLNFRVCPAEEIAFFSAPDAVGDEHHLQQQHGGLRRWRWRSPAVFTVHGNNGHSPAARFQDDDGPASGSSGISPTRPM